MHLTNLFNESDFMAEFSAPQGLIDILIRDVPDAIMQEQPDFNRIEEIIGEFPQGDKEKIQKAL